MNNKGNYELSLINIPINVSENDTIKWLRPIEITSCQLLETKDNKNERTAILEVESIDLCEKIYQKIENQIEVMPYFPTSIEPFYIHKKNNFNIQKWLKPLSCYYIRSNYIISKYIQIFLDLNEWSDIIQHNGKYDITIFKKMKIESLNKLIINDIPLSISKEDISNIIIKYGAQINNFKKNQDDTAFTAILTFKNKILKDDFYQRKRFLEFDDGYATMETLKEIYFIPLSSSLAMNN